MEIGDLVKVNIPFFSPLHGVDTYVGLVVCRSFYTRSHDLSRWCVLVQGKVTHIGETYMERINV
jgi:hypothetical protein